MKKVLVLLLACLSCSIMFAQSTPWGSVVNSGETTMNWTCAIFIDGEELGAAALNYELGAFCGDEPRGSWFPPTFSNNHYVYYMSFNGENGEYITFKIWDHANNQELDVVYADDPLQYVPNGTGGNSRRPKPVNFVSNTSAGFDLDITPYNTERDHYYLIASPVGAVAANAVTNLRSNSFDLYSFAENPEIDPETGIGKEWINHREDETYELQPGYGYLYANSGDPANPGDVTLTFNGAAYETEHETVSVPLAYNETAEFAGCNLVGNPFSVTAYLNHEYYVMNEDGYDLMPATEGLPAMQGCFVFAESGEESVVFSLANAKRASLALNLSNGHGIVDRAIVRFDEGRRLPKFQLWNNSSKVYIPMDNQDYAVVCSEGMGELPVSFKAVENGSYSLTATNAEVSFSYLHLIDNMTGADVDLLATPSYSFDARTTDYASRFRLVFATGSSADGDSFGFVNASGNLCIFGIEGEATLQVMDVTGRILSTETFSGSYEKQLNAAPGVYMLRLTNGNDVKVQKMVVR